jgi:hypothetical protein
MINSVIDESKLYNDKLKKIMATGSKNVNLNKLNIQFLNFIN